MKWNWLAAAGAALMVASFVAPAAQAASIAGLEGARAKARMGERLTPRERELLRKYGGSHRSQREIEMRRMHRQAP